MVTDVFRSSASSWTNFALYICPEKYPFHLEFQIYRHKSIHDMKIKKFSSIYVIIFTFLFIISCVFVFFFTSFFFSCQPWKRYIYFFKSFKKNFTWTVITSAVISIPNGFLQYLAHIHHAINIYSRILFFPSYAYISFFYFLLIFCYLFSSSWNKTISQPFQSFIFNKIIKTMSYILSTALASPHKFWYILFSLYYF